MKMYVASGEQQWFVKEQAAQQTEKEPASQSHKKYTTVDSLLHQTGRI